ncbi:MAG: acetyl/propionyl/methylcrotonyl-CoA carboxylase subunit alpha [Candidatus Bipolaricaulia bacterium]
MSPEPLFNKILVANRGEIALRIVEACRQLGIPSVAVFSEADREALHARLADEAYCIGPAPAQDSYLNLAAIMSAAEVSGAEAIHPGYGFLSEDAEFAEVCEDSGFTFIGPSQATMRLTGDKLATKQALEAHGLPTVPGTDAMNTEAEAQEAAERLGYPLIIKSAAGGGGRGMRFVHDSAELFDRFHAARREAEAAFGNGAVYFEKHLGDARHIEVQIVADGHGNVVHWGERECSIQRRYQKLIEETPAPNFDPELRQQVCETAVEAAHALGYRNAGTVECLVSDEAFYIIEINARIQVEHPVSEMRAGRDLVMDQIRIAAGEPLPYEQSDLELTGHAIECRINAEDPLNDFMPAAGDLRVVGWPGGPGVRIDTHIYNGVRIPPNYDSLLAKLIGYADDRDGARGRMIGALRRLHIESLPTTAELCLEILEHPVFVAGEATTRFLEQQLSAKSG